MSGTSAADWYSCLATLKGGCILRKETEKRGEKTRLAPVLMIDIHDWHQCATTGTFANAAYLLTYFTTKLQFHGKPQLDLRHP